MQKEKKNRTLGALISVGIHVALLLLCLFWMAWLPPDPPLPVYGIQLNMGNVDAGSGDQQLTQPTNQPVEETQEEPFEELEEETAEESVEEPVEESESEVQQPTEAESFDTDMPPVEEKQKTEATKEPKKDQPSTAPKSKPSRDEKQESQNTQENSNGDQPNANGDQGDPEGSLESDALYGSPGEGGAGLQMTGWVWDRAPKPKDESDASGRIVFQVTINEDGEIIQVKTMEKTVPPDVVKIYQNEVYKLTFSKTRDNVSPAPTSTGTITFILKGN